MIQNDTQLRTWFLYALFFHMLFIALLFLSLSEYSLLQHKPARVLLLPPEQLPLRQQPQKSIAQPKKIMPKDQSTFTVPVPITYYGNQLDPHKTPGQPGGVTQSDTSIPRSLEISKTHEIPLQNNTQSDNASLPSTTEDSIASKQETTATEPIHEPIESVLTQKPLHSYLATSSDASKPQEPSDAKKITTQKKIISEQKKTTSTAHTPPQTKQLTLADLFKNPLMATDHEHLLGQGSGQPVVIREGDMRYYSVWTKFLKHLNDVAHFNRIKNKTPIKQWLQSGLLKHNLLCGITVTKEGKVLGIDIMASSGYNPFDQMCIEDIWAASPFPPLPHSMGKEKARFEVRSYF